MPTSEPSFKGGWQRPLRSASSGASPVNKSHDAGQNGGPGLNMLEELDVPLAPAALMWGKSWRADSTHAARPEELVVVRVGQAVETIGEGVPGCRRLWRNAAAHGCGRLPSPMPYVRCSARLCADRVVVQFLFGHSARRRWSPWPQASKPKLRPRSCPKCSQTCRKRLILRVCA